tara:strand:- start:1823 stop:2017 length:195 start_codon:yes stop_codon:yes gene_type:complete
MMYRNQAGKMGAMSSQPAKRKIAASVDPLERLNQKMAGRMQGGLAEGKDKKKKKPSLMNSIGMM